MVLCRQIKGNNLIEQKARTTIYNHPKENKKEKEQERKETDDEPFNRQEVYIL